MEKKYLNFEDLKIWWEYFCEVDRTRYKVVSRYKDILWCYLRNAYKNKRSDKKCQLTKNSVDWNFFH